VVVLRGERLHESKEGCRVGTKRIRAVKVPGRLCFVRVGRWPDGGWGCMAESVNHHQREEDTRTWGGGIPYIVKMTGYYRLLGRWSSARLWSPVYTESINGPTYRRPWFGFFLLPFHFHFHDYFSSIRTS